LSNPNASKDDKKTDKTDKPTVVEDEKDKPQLVSQDYELYEALNLLKAMTVLKR
jgi:hypothetical protein